MRRRVLSGAVLAVFLAAIILFDQTFPLALNIAVAIIAAAAVFELGKALGLEKKGVVFWPSLAAAAAVPFCSGRLLFLAYALYTLIICCAMLAYHEEVSFKDIFVQYSMVVLIPCALHSLVLLRELNRAHGMFYVLLAVFAAWAADMGAFFAGTFFGKHKLCPKISPKKTVEGAVGGLVANVASALLCPLFLIGFFGAFVSMLGDLSFSLIKRSCHIKDFGQVIPGHGGILDRFDSVIFTAPFVYLLISFLPVAG